MTPWPLRSRRQQSQVDAETAARHLRRVERRHRRSLGFALYDADWLLQESFLAYLEDAAPPR